MASEYSLVEKVNVLRGLFDVFEVMYPQLQDIDFRKDATKLDVPVYLTGCETTSFPRAATWPSSGTTGWRPRKSRCSR